MTEPVQDPLAELTQWVRERDHFMVNTHVDENPEVDFRPALDGLTTADKAWLLVVRDREFNPD